MKELLTYVKARLISQLDYIRDDDVYITPDIDLVPQSCKRPCVGITDGNIAHRELMSDVIESDMAVTVVVYVGIQKPEGALMGDTATSAKGVLDIIDDVNAALDEYMPTSAYIYAFAGSETASETVSDGQTAMTRKTITFLFQKQEDR